MKIGIDLSPLQSGHRMRGVGAVITNLINNIPKDVKHSSSFVFYMKPGKKEQRQALDLLDLSDINYEVRDKLNMSKKIYRRRELLFKVVNKFLGLLTYYTGIKDSDYSDLDVYLLTDQMDLLPKAKNVNKVMIAYDLIPYILEWDYLRSYRSMRILGFGYKPSLGAALRRYMYITKVRINAKKCRKVLAISKQTKDDFVRYAKVPADKIHVTYLGISMPDDNCPTKIPDRRYISTSWGYFAKDYKFDTDCPFILFVGGTDARRKIDDLVTAYNHLRAEGHNLKLVFSGDILHGPNNLPVRESREALLNTSYIDDIFFLGFTDQEVKNWLFKNALAFVYPSNYEGFGLPVLEAMSFGTPVVTYRNTSLEEISGDAAIYAADAKTIKESVERLLDKSLRQDYSKKSKKQAAKFTWVKTSVKIFAILTG